MTRVCIDTKNLARAPECRRVGRNQAIQVVQHSLYQPYCSVPSSVPGFPAPVHVPKMFKFLVQDLQVLFIIDHSSIHRQIGSHRTLNNRDLFGPENGSTAGNPASVSSMLQLPSRSDAPPLQLFQLCSQPWFEES